MIHEPDRPSRTRIAVYGTAELTNRAQGRALAIQSIAYRNFFQTGASQNRPTFSGSQNVDLGGLLADSRELGPRGVGHAARRHRLSHSFQF
jgi:hypothetical protein